jgi:hypothetical protein
MAAAAVTPTNGQGQAANRTNAYVLALLLLLQVFSIGGFSWLVSSYLVEPELVLEVARDGQLSPQLEISVAMLITMSCWRGMAARLRL